MKGLTAEIFRWKLGECSNGGISGRVDSVTVVGPEIDGPFEPDDDQPAVKIIRRMICGKEYIHAEPLKRVKGLTPYMFGGTFIYSSDSRFSRCVSPYPVPLHDRQETWEMYERMSV